MKKGKRRVFSNYPIFDKKLGSSLKWSPEIMASDSLHDAVVIIDEAYQYYNSRNYKGFSADDHSLYQGGMSVLDYKGV